MNPTVGIIGLGNLGAIYAEHLLKKQFRVIGYDIDPDRIALLDEFGITAAASPADVAAQADILITSLPSAAAVRTVISGENGIVSAEKPGQILIETSTLPVEEKLAAHAAMAAVGKILLDSPISGTPPMVRGLTSSLYVSGDRDAYNTVLPVIEAFTGSNSYVGSVGDGSRVKILANYLVLVHTVAAAECMTLAQKSGLDLSVAHDVLLKGAGASKMLELRGLHMVNSDYRESGPTIMAVALKDAQIISEHAATVQSPIDLFASARQRFVEVAAQGFDHFDLSAVALVIEKAAGIDREHAK